jgi:hypothetical protein
MDGKKRIKCLQGRLPLWDLSIKFYKKNTFYNIADRSSAGAGYSSRVYMILAAAYSFTQKCVTVCNSKENNH